MLGLRQQNLIVVLVIDPPQRLDQFSGISADAHVEVLEVPGGDDDVHDDRPTDDNEEVMKGVGAATGRAMEP